MKADGPLVLSRVRRWSAAAPLAAVLGVLSLASSAAAQVKAIEPRPVVVTTDGASLRCGAGEVWYVVGQVKSGDLLTADGESYGWHQVSYPSGAPALVAAADGDLVSGRGVVKLTKPSKLYAFASGAGAQGAGAVQASWRPLLKDPLAPGTELRHVQTLVDAAGKAAGYLVAAPAEARAYISSQAVREATEQERLAAAGVPAAAAPAATSTPAPTSTPVPASAPAQANAPASTPAPGQPAEQPAPVTSEPAAEQPAPSEPAQLTMESNRSGAPADEPLDAEPDFSNDPIGGRIASFDTLEPRYRAVIAQPIESAELDQLIGEYERLQGSLGDSIEDRAMRPAVQGRLELLRIRADLQKDLQRLAALETKAKTDVSEIQTKIREYQASRPYTVVGRLSVSTIYDGRNNMPLMYRLQSVEGDVGRTLAYVIPSKNADVAGKIGLIVGVEGDARRDSGLQVDIIEANRVDVLTSAAETAEQP